MLINVHKKFQGTFEEIFVKLEVNYEQNLEKLSKIFTNI